MTRRLNGRFLLAIVAAAVAIGMATHWLHKYQVRRGAAGLLRLAAQAEQQGRWDRAQEYLSRYLVHRPDDVEALARHAALRERSVRDNEDRAKLLKIYARILRNDPGRLEIRRRVAVLEIELGQYAEALIHLDALSGAGPGGDGLEYLRGRCYEGNGHYSRAAEHYEMARKPGVTPAEADSIDCHARLARLLRARLGDGARGDRVMAELVARHSRSAAAFLASATYRRKFERPGADDDVVRALQLSPEDGEVLLAAAASAQRLGSPDRARGYLETGIRLHPRTLEFYKELAELELRDGRKDRAVALLKKGTELFPDAPALRWLLVDVLASVGRVEDAATELVALEDAKLPRDLVDYLRARVQMGRHRWAEAARQLEGVRASLVARPETQDLALRASLLQGECFEQLGNAERRHAAYQRAVALATDPGTELWKAAHLGLASALVGLGKLDEAIAEYRAIQQRVASARVAIARLQVIKGLNRPAAERARSWSEIEQALATLEQADPGSAAGASLRATILAAQGRAGEARAMLERAIRADSDRPDRIDLWISLANLSLHEGKPETALGVLDEARGRLGDTIGLRLATSRLWGQRGGNDAVAALEALERGAGSLPNDQQRARLWRQLAGDYARIGRGDLAGRVWRRLADQQPGDLDARLALLQGSLHAGDLRAAAGVLAEIRGIDGEDGACWAYGRAASLVEQARREIAAAQGAGAERAMPEGARRDLREARELLTRAAALRPSWALVPLCEARVDLLGGRPETAIKQYVRAITELGVRDPEVIRTAARLLRQRRRYDQATLLIQALQKDGVPISAELQRLQVEIFGRSGDHVHALELAEAVVKDDSGDYGDLVWLGHTRRAAGKPAAPVFRRAIELDPKAPDAWLGLVEALVAAGSGDEIQAAVSDAEKALPADKFALELARCHELAGHVDRAQGLYRAALEAYPRDADTLRNVAAFYLRRNRLAEARAHLTDLRTVARDEENGIWARTVLAQITALGGSHRDVLKALEILEDRGGAAPPSATEESPGVLRTRARLLAMQPGRERRQEAIATLERAIAGRPPRPDDLHLLAQLYEADGNWPKARQHLLSLLGSQPDNPAALAAYVQSLLRQRRPEEARAALARLESLAPRWPTTIELKARLLHALNKDDEAVSLLKDFVKAEPKQVATIALLLEQLGLDPAAEELYRRSASEARRPASTLRLAAFLGRKGRTNEALDLCEGAWEASPPEEVSNACVTILYGARGDSSAHQRRVEGRLLAAIAAHPGRDSLAFDLANLRGLQRRYAEAESLLREIAGRNDRRSGPLNNLAWLIALQGGSRGEEAMAIIGRAVELDGETPDLLDTRAVARLALGQGEAAARDLEGAIAVAATADKYFHLAQAYLMTGKRAEADEALHRARAMGLDIAGLHPLERSAFERLTAALARR